MNRLETVQFTRENILSLPKAIDNIIRKSYQALPIFCFPEVIEKIPISLTYCFIYLLGSDVTIGVGFYLYFYYIFKSKLAGVLHDEEKTSTIKVKDGHRQNKQDTNGKPDNKTLLSRMLPSKQDTEMSEVSVFISGKP